MGGSSSQLYVDSALLEKDLTGQVALITGANCGVGKRLAQQLAEQGATTVLACRRVDAGEAAAQEIKDGGAKGDLDVMEVSLDDLASVRAFAAAFKSKYDKLDMLVNNAGIMATPERWTTKDGFEAQIGVNHFGHFLLTNLLLDKVTACQGRICILSSCYHDTAFDKSRGRIDFDDIHYETRPYSKWEAYAQSKLANVLHARELAKRVEGTGVTVASAHPGWVDTELGRHMGMQRGTVSYDYFVQPMLGLMGQIQVWEGIQSQLKVLLADDIEAGAYYAAKSPTADLGGWPKETSAEGQNLDDARRLWEVSEKATA